jgi:hypothetical protein
MQNKTTIKRIMKTATLISLLLTSFHSLAITTLSVHYLVAAEDSLGTNAQASVTDLNDGIAQLNSAFASMGLNFVINEVQYLTNLDVPGINDGAWNTDEEENVRPFFKYGKLNIIVTDLDGANGHAYWDYESTDVIEVEPENLNSSTIAHELGHNLSLKHTYQSIGDGPISLHEGSLGWKYGDGLVDTPVDPGSRSNFENCIYLGDAVDGEGTAYHPNGFNIMGKGQGVCRDYFSPQQIKRMKRIFATSKFHMHDKYGVGENPTCANSTIVDQFPHKEGFNFNEDVSTIPWVQDSFKDNFNWVVSFDTSSPNTGANLPVEGHSFVHIDAGHELLNSGDKVNLLSPCYDLTNQSSAYAEFYYQMYGENTGKLALEISTDNGSSWSELWSKSGQQHTSGVSWTKAEVNLGDFTGQKIQLQLKGEVLTGYKGDISIDTITVSTESSTSGQPYPEHNDILVETRVSKSSDDAEERVSSGSVSITSSDLELVNEAVVRNQLVGIRFPFANLPKGAIIKSAMLQFTVDDDTSDNTNLVIKGHQVTDSKTFTDTDKDISTRVTTTASVAWSPVPWMSVGEAGPNQQTPSLISIVQELVNQNDWDSNSPVTFIISGDGEREAESYDGSSSRAPKLFITYTIEGTAKTLGDWDDDGDVDMTDIRLFMRALQMGGVIDASFDLNNDGSINSLDARAMIRLCTRDNCAV